MSASRSLGIVFALTLLALALFPLVGDRFYVQFASKIMILAIFAMSLDLLVGQTGLVSLGHALYYGLAGYALVLLVGAGGQSLWWLLPAAAALAALAALAVGALVLRTSGVYFIMVTLAFAQMAYFFVHDSQFFGGSDGKYLAARPSLGVGEWQPLDLGNHVGRFYLAWVCLVAAYVGLRALCASSFGRALAGIRENEQRMRSLGFPTFRYKLAAFVIAGALAGVAGALTAVQDGVMNPEHLGWHRSGAVLLMVILGGTGTLAGPALGAAAFMLLELLFSTWTKHWQLLMGGFIVLLVLFAPRGLAGLFGPFGRAR
jgi:branched-chain amino acid transport system permease protein